MKNRKKSFKKGAIILAVILLLLVILLIMMLTLFIKGELITDKIEWPASGMFISSDSKLAIIETNIISTSNKKIMQKISFSRQSLFDLNTGERILDIPTDQMRESTFSPDLTKIVYLVPDEKSTNELGFAAYKKIYMIDINSGIATLLTPEEHLFYNMIFTWRDNNIVYSCKDPSTEDKSLNQIFEFCELDLDSKEISILEEKDHLYLDKKDITELWPKVIEKRDTIHGRDIEIESKGIFTPEGMGHFITIYSVRVDGDLEYRGSKNPYKRTFVSQEGDVYLLLENQLRKLV